MAKLENDLLVLNNKVDPLSLRFDPGFDACIRSVGSSIGNVDERVMNVPEASIRGLDCCPWVPVVTRHWCRPPGPQNCGPGGFVLQTSVAFDRAMEIPAMGAGACDQK